MPETNEGLLLVIGSAFFLIGLLGGGFEISAVKIPSIGKGARLVLGGIGLILLGLGLTQIIVPPSVTQPPSAVVETPTAVSTAASVSATETQLPVTSTPAPSPTAAARAPNTPVPEPSDTHVPSTAPISTLAPAAEPTDGQTKRPAGWESVLDLPRHVNALIGDPGSSEVMYAGCGSSGAGSGVYRSENGGLIWTKASSGLPSEDVRALAITRSEPTTLYATVGSRGTVFTSVDDAASWTELGSYDLPGFEAQLAVAPTDDDLLFAAEDVRGLYRSRDGGHGWREVGEGLPKNEHDVSQVQSVAIDPTDANVVLAGTGWGSFNANGVYRSADGGDTWAPANRGMPDYGITALALNPMDSQVVYAGGANGELFKSTDGAGSWTQLTGDLPFEETFSQRVLAISIDPDGPETIYLLHEREGVLFSTDGGNIWRVLGTPSELDHPTFTAMTVVFQPEPVVVAGIRGEGGWRYIAP